MSGSLFEEAVAVGGVVRQSEPETRAVVLLEFVNKHDDGKTTTMKFTLRTGVGEDEFSLWDRAMTLQQHIESQPEGFKMVDGEPKRYGGGGNGGNFPKKDKSPAILGGAFDVTHVMRFETKNKTAGKPNWNHVRFFGQQNGQEVFAESFFGSSDWQPKDSAIAQYGKFQDILAWPLEAKRQIPNTMNITVSVKEGKYGWEVTGIS